MDTRTDLVLELKKLEPNSLIEELIREAESGEYHDFKSNRYACGKIEASRKLRAANLIDLALKIENGDFDEPPDEEDKLEMRKLVPIRMWESLGLK